MQVLDPQLSGAVRIQQNRVALGNFGQLIDPSELAESAENVGELELNTSLIDLEKLGSLEAANFAPFLISSGVAGSLFGPTVTVGWIGPIYCKEMAGLFISDGNEISLTLPAGFAEIDLVLEDTDKIAPVIITFGTSPINLIELFRANFELQAISSKPISCVVVVISDEYVVANELIFGFAEEISSIEILDSLKWSRPAPAGLVPDLPVVEFPQADSIAKIIKICALVSNSTLNPNFLGSKFRMPE